MLHSRIWLSFTALMLLAFISGCGESNQQRQRSWSKINELTSVDLMEQSAEALKKQYFTTIEQPGDRTKLLPMVEAIAHQADCIDWEDFFSKNKHLENAYAELNKRSDGGGHQASYVFQAQARRSSLVAMRTEPRLECARINLKMGNKQAARDHLRKLLEKHPTFIATWEFMVQAWQAYEPHDIEFQKVFRIATEDSARLPGVKDRQYHIWWLDQVLTQKPADGTFKFYQNDFPKKG